jgi:class 3 adenylate cyclase
MTFRAKILLALVALAGGLTVATLFATQRVVTRVQRATAEDAFERDVAFAGALQAARLGGVRATCLELARSVRLVAAIEEGDAAILYRIALDELREVMRPTTERGRAATFARLLGPDGRVLRPTDERAGLLGADGAEAAWERALTRAGAVASRAIQEVGYLAPEVNGIPTLHEVVLTRIVDAVSERRLGTLVLGFAMDDPGAEAGAIVPIRMGIWLERRLFSRTIPATLVPALAAALDAPTTEPIVTLDAVPHRVFVHAIGESLGLPPTYQVGLYSLGPLLAAEQEVRTVVLLLGALSLAVAMIAAAAIARGLTGPVTALVAGAHEIEEGRFDVRVPVRRDDELGRLSAAFNEMAAGLAMRDRYRSLLDLVADKRVADELIAGGEALGGELREVSVLFCDVCAFTGLTESMAPTEVIELLNTHMAAMTEVVHRHGGVVDKFMGDGIMALFGAPTSTGDDADAALDAARGMIAARRAANAGAAHPLEVHIGIASGTVVAGCMGSPDRLDYTVLGARVNLAARLCGQAGPMEIVIDETTRARLRRAVALETPAELALKGFSAAVAAYRVRSEPS